MTSYLRLISVFFLTGFLAAQTIAITLDDGPRLQATPLLSPGERNAAILKHFHEAGVQGMFFVTLNNGADRPEGLALLKALADGGQLIANHTVSHPDFNAAETTLEAFEGEVRGCDQVLRTCPGYRKFLRFPYLREGATQAKRDGIRTFLRQEGYRIGYVSIDTSDWLIDDKLCRKLAQQPSTELGPWRSFYLDHVWRRAQIYRQLALAIYGRDVPQVLLLHHNLLNALFLGDVLALFKAKGWLLVSPDQAYADGAYQVLPKVLPLDGSVLESTALALGLPLKPFFADVQSEQDTGAGAEQL